MAGALLGLIGGKMPVYGITPAGMGVMGILVSVCPKGCGTPAVTGTVGTAPMVNGLGCGIELGGIIWFME